MIDDLQEITVGNKFHGLLQLLGLLSAFNIKDRVLLLLLFNSSDIKNVLVLVPQKRWNAQDTRSNDGSPKKAVAFILQLGGRVQAIGSKLALGNNWLLDNSRNRRTCWDVRLSCMLRLDIV